MSSVTWTGPKPKPEGTVSQLVMFLKSHPIIFLLLLTPGIPEYLSASSQLTVLVINPILFFLFLGANMGLYGSGVILIREAMVRWKKGWASVFLLGVAYGILEEGIDLWTLFYSKASPVGNLGYYGHWLGVNWVWTIGLLIFHSVYSIGLPIFLFGLVFPQLKSKSLISGKKLALTVTCLVFDSIFLFLFVSGFYTPYNPGGGLLIFSGLAIAILVALARLLPGDFLKTRFGEPRWSPFRFACLGALLFPATLFAGGIAAGANIPPIVPFVLDAIMAIVILQRAYVSMGTSHNQEQKVALSIGLLFPIALFGLIASVGLANPLIVVADILLIVFSRRLWRKWHSYAILQNHDVQRTLPSFGGPPSPSPNA
ncbi:MAG TPA: hypothetical protein VE955_05175 [Candidatus Dormibacteraeota bacterium]|nr:hypothetical protein [Candidatus Dormibacteraeota bacterium]